MFTIWISIFFRKARRGLLTTILLHLCTSIICLTCVLYITAAIESSRIGCRIANMARTYFILVSLMWNAVEARNMYRNLIKVFVNTGDRFIYKAAAAAWSKFSLFFQVADGCYTGAYCKFICYAFSIICMFPTYMAGRNLITYKTKSFDVRLEILDLWVIVTWNTTRNFNHKIVNCIFMLNCKNNRHTHIYMC